MACGNGSLWLFAVELMPVGPQVVLADKSGFHRAQVGAFERGEVNITLASLLLLAEILRVKVVGLFKGIED